MLHIPFCHSVIDLVTAHKRSLRRLCFHTCLSVHMGGMHGLHGFLGGAWFFGGVCMVFWGCVHDFLGGHAWFLGGMRGFLGGACVVFFGGVHGFSGGHAWFLSGGHAWFVHKGACMVFLGCVCGFFDEIWSMSGQYTSYWNAF